MMPPLNADRRRAGAAAIVAALVVAATNSPTADAAGKQPREHGAAVVASVDGPAQLTVRSRGQRIKLRLAYIDAPAPGECGAAEATTTLTRKAMRKRGRVRYVLLANRPDADGRYPAFVGPRNADLLERSLAHDLVQAEWARPVGRTTVNEMDNAYLYVGGDRWGPRAAQGVWAQCGGRLHLPAGEPVPAHAPAPWTIDANGLTQAVGPITLDPTLAPGRTLTVAQVSALAPVELADHSGETCWARVPSLEIVVMAATPTAKQACGTAEVIAIASWGPGHTSTSRGVGTGSPLGAAVAAFPRLAASWDDEEDSEYIDLLPLTGFTSVPWAWQTIASVSDARKITSLLTSTAAWPR